MLWEIEQVDSIELRKTVATCAVGRSGGREAVDVAATPQLVGAKRGVVVVNGEENFDHFLNSESSSA